jgi:pilus assembly protein FimV
VAIDKARVLAAAQKQLARGNIDKALKELARIVRDDPKDLRVRQKVAELLARQGKVAEAMREFAVVAEAYERGGFYPKAAAIYKQMLRFEPDQMRWHLALGEIYQQLALLSDAMDHFNIVAQHFEQNGSSRERIEIYEKLLKLNPDSVEYGEKLADLYTKEADAMGAYEVWKNLSQTLEQRGDIEALVRVYEKMSALKPEELTLVRALADLYLDRGDPKRALAKLQICFKSDPQDTETLNLLADAFVDLGEREKAVAVLKELAQIYDSLGYEDYRNQVYDRIAEIDPNQGASYDGDASLELPGGEDAIVGLDLTEEEQAGEEAQRAVAEAEVYIQYGLADKAQGMLEKATAKDPQAYSAHRMLVRILASAGDLTGAQDRLNTMYEIAMDLGDYAAARICLERASELVPDDDAARARLDAFVDAMGDMVGSEPVSEADDDMAVMASAIALGQTIAKETEPEPEPEDDFGGGGFDEFDFDDDEMQRLAAELSKEMEGDSTAVTFDAPKPDAPSFEIEDEEEDEQPADVEDEIDVPFDFDIGPGADDSGLGDIIGQTMPSPEPAPAPPSDLGGDAFGDLLDDLDFDGDSLDDIPSRTAWEIGRSYYDSGMYEDAALEFQRSVDLNESIAGSLEYLGHSLRRVRDFRGAVNAYKQLLTGALTDRGDVLRIMYELGVTYEAAGNRRGAYKILRKISAQEPDFRDGEVANRVAALALELGIG